MGDSSSIEVPYFIKVYCQNRYTEILEYLDDKTFKKLFRDKEINIKVLDGKGQYAKCLVTRPVKPLTVLRNPMLLMAAELEFRTYKTTHRISLQEARYLLIDSYPKCNCITEPYSALNLIKEKKGSFKLSLTEIVTLAKERRERKMQKCYA